MNDETREILTTLLKNVTDGLEELDDINHSLSRRKFTEKEKGFYDGREQAYLEFRDWLTQLTHNANAPPWEK